MLSLKKIAIPMLTLLLVVSAIGLTNAAPSTQAIETLNIGFMQAPSSTGDFGVRLAIDQINREGGIVGPDGALYRLQVVYPNRPPFAPDGVPDAVTSLVAQKAIAIIGPVDNRLAFPNLEVLAQAEVPVLTLATTDALTELDPSDNIMRIRAADRFYNEGLATVLIDERAITSFALIQTDVDSTEALLGFEGILVNRSLTPTVKIQEIDNSNLQADAERILQGAPAAVVMWGPPEDAETLLLRLRENGFTGLFVYRDAQEAVRSGAIPISLARGMMGATSWSYTTPTELGRAFLVDYVTSFNSIPTGVEAAAYDAVWILRRQIEQTGGDITKLREGLLQTPTIYAVQGRLEPSTYGGGDFSRAVTVYTMGDLGGPQLVARFANNVRLGDDDLVATDVRVVGLAGTLTYTPSPSPTPTLTPIPSATPSEVTLTVPQESVNLRAGPGTEYEIVGQLQLGDTATVIGSNADFTWLVINHEGQTVWVAADIVDVFDPGNLLSQLPIVQPGTNNPGIEPGQLSEGIDLTIEGVVLSPPQISPGQPFTVQVTVRNLGVNAAGSFSVSAILQPGNLTITAGSTGLGAGQSAIVTLNGTVDGTGSYTSSITVDATNAVLESNENNNVFPLTYVSDRPILSRIDFVQIPVGTAFDFAGGTADMIWTGTQIEGQNNARFGIVYAGAFEAVDYNAIDPSVVINFILPGSNIGTGSLIGFITAEGRRGVMRVDSLVGTALTVSYRVYSN
ncbi:MAG: ABC transporter substrate-binding protein [Chloroflexi bacterium]|nr:ABC transporter substrate-binding protein [Chloroflexota bacterium]